MKPLPGLPARLRSARLARGTSLAVTAVAAGIDPGHLSRLERGLVVPGYTTLYRLALVLELDDLTTALAPYVAADVA